MSSKWNGNLIKLMEALNGVDSYISNTEKLGVVIFMWDAIESVENIISMQEEHHDKQIASLHASHETEMENMKTQYKERARIPEYHFSRNEKLPDYQGGSFHKKAHKIELQQLKKANEALHEAL